ncbi:hypothetical protein J2W14_000637 [Pseudarthrobacter oxydans]|uniref:hypothetical protein n=1 Tax=Pseudarthrobacter oxydans TaxID=1671 RepID=UPI0027846D5D|nr:hypothetical protein [Pseudarthrobacter oxydans]MDP9981261.1 hypothetical protein [Pseudarthrobacter oxydans]
MKARGTVVSRRLASISAVSDWRSLKAGDRVEILKHAQVLAAGEVEEVSLSGNVLWLVPVVPSETQLFLKSDGVEVRRS